MYLTTPGYEREALEALRLLLKDSNCDVRHTTERAIETVKR